MLSPAVRSIFVERLMGAGWDPAHSHLYTRQFTLRNEVLTFRVTREFPAITAHHLQTAGLPIERFSHVSYILSTSGLVPDSPPTEPTGTWGIMNEHFQNVYLAVLAGLKAVRVLRPYNPDSSSRPRVAIPGVSTALFLATLTIRRSQ